MAFHHLVELRNRNGSRVSAARASYFVTGGWATSERANTAHYLSAGPYYIDVLSSACIAELLLINSDDIGFREGHLSLSTAINVVPYSPLPEEKKNMRQHIPSWRTDNAESIRRKVTQRGRADCNDKDTTIAVGFRNSKGRSGGQIFQSQVEWNTFSGSLAASPSLWMTRR